MENDPTQKPALMTLCALAIASALSLFAVTWPEQFMSYATLLNEAFLRHFSHSVLWISSLQLLLCFGLAFSPLGKIRLGRDDERPEFSTIAWLSMLFAAGMGAGILYWGVAEPITHFGSPPDFTGAMAETDPARMSMVISYLHWCFHPWGIYAAGALVIAYFSFCKGYAVLPSAPFRALLPEQNRVTNGFCDVIDGACVIALLLGMAAAMAAGTMQIAGGLQWLGFHTENPVDTYLIIVPVMAAVYLTSAATTLDQGIKGLSELNMVLACLMAVLVAAYTSISGITSTLWHGVVDYLHFLPSLSVTALDSPAQPHWSEVWTANYFLSWIAWVPFVGIFVARISRGRTIREFVFGVILAPSIFTFIWFAIFGGAALHLQQTGALDLITAVKEDTAQAFFSLLSIFPGAYWLNVLVTIVVFVFLVTGADSASYVLAMLAGRGTMNPSVKAKLFWGVAIALLTCGTLFSKSGIYSIRAVFSFAGITVFFIMIGQVLCLMWELFRRIKKPT